MNVISPPIKQEETISFHWPKISIITPSFNQAEFIEETILSILNQNYPNLEYIIIDGGSTDDSVNIIKKYEHKLSYWVSEKDNGQSDAINKGFKKCTGDIVNWINSDDILAENALFSIADHFAKNKIQILVGASKHWDPINDIVIPHTTNPITFKELLRYNETICLPQPSVFYTKDLLTSAGYLNEELHYTMDLDLWFRFGLIEGIENKIAYTSNLISLMRIQSNQKTSKMNFKAMKEASKVVRHYAKKYNLNFKQRCILAYKYRGFRFSLAKNNSDKLRFLDIILLKFAKKLFKWKI